MMTCGGVVSSVTVMLAVAAAPPLDVALAVRMLGPSARGIDALKLPFATEAGIEFMTTVAVGSLTVPVTVVGLRLRKLRSAGAVMVTVGAE